MKKFNLSLVTILAMGAFAVAGGDIEPVAEPIVEVVASDDSGFYIGGAYSSINAEVDAYGAYGNYDEPENWRKENSEMDSAGFMLQAGYQFNKYIAVEGRYWKASSEASGTYSNGQDDQTGFTDSWSDECGDLTAWGIFVKPMYPVTDAFSIYGLLGYGNTNISDEWYGDGVELLDESGFQWGIGASYAYDEHLSFFVDYVQLASDVEESYDWVANNQSDSDYDYVDWETSVYTINVGVSYKF